jgi:thiosulfate/3-mercaptopyruvate sulfurtransferase
MPIEAPPPTVRDSMLVTADWLKAHLNDSNLVVLHADRNRAAFDEGHIPVARFAEWAGFTTSSETRTAEMPTMEALGAWARSLGLRPNQRIIIYGDPVPAARLYFTLEYLALTSRASILDGGLAGWRAAGGEVAARPVEYAKSDFQPRFVWRELIVDADLIKTRLGDSTTAILDARSLDEYKGTKGPADLRPGHVPGAASLDWTTLLDNGKFKSPTVLRGMFEQAGVAPGDDLIVYCHSGARSSVAWFVARYLGYRPKMYDGSMEDWGRKGELPIER